MKRDMIIILGVLTLLLTLLLSGCTDYVPARVQQPVIQEPTTDASTAETPDIAAEETAAEETAQETQKTPIKKDIKYTPTEAEPIPAETPEHGNCGCSYTWNPVCDKDLKTHISLCLFKCFGNTDEDLLMNVQCPKKIDAAYTSEEVRDFESKMNNRGYCWRTMYDSITRKDIGTRRCDNLIVNGRVDDAPEPARGNWLDEEHLITDWTEDAEGYTIKLTEGMIAINEEYNETFQPLFEKGTYRLSFKARQESAAMNDWKSEFTMQDWWSNTPAPEKKKNCYKVQTMIDAQEVYIENLPDEWKVYNYEFDLPIEDTQWDSFTRTTEGCSYAWDGMPGGYKIELTGPSLGSAYFDDFKLERIE